jgi:predicted kinase
MNAGVSTDQPRLVIIGGAAASGKTTLAAVIAREARLPLLARDGFKEALMDALGCADRKESRRLGVAAYAVLFATLDRLLDAGVGAVIESNFSHGIAERDLRERVKRARAVQIHCQTTPDIIRRRYAARAASGLRHSGHFDSDPETLADLETSLTGDRHQPLDLGIPLLRVDTTDGYAPALSAVLAFAIEP